MVFLGKKVRFPRPKKWIAKIQ